MYIFGVFLLLWGGMHDQKTEARTSLVAQRLRICLLRASLVVQWLRIRLPMQGTRVPALVREDSTCRGATKPVSHNY